MLTDQYLSDIDEGKFRRVLINSNEIEVDDKSEEEVENETVPPRNFIDKRASSLLGGFRFKNESPKNGAPPALADASIFKNAPSDPIGTQMTPRVETNATKTTMHEAAANNPPVSSGLNNGKKNQKFKFLKYSVNLGGADTASQPILNFIVSPDNYPETVITEDTKRVITDYLNDAIKARSLRQSNEIIAVNKIIHRSGLLLIRTNDELSSEWIQFMILDHHWNDLKCKLIVTEENRVRFAPTYTAWVPDEKASFEYFMQKVHLLGIQTDTWRFIRIIREKVKTGTVGKKFSFVANGNIADFLTEKGDLHFNFDFYPQRAVIKATADALNAGSKTNLSNTFLFRKLKFQALNSNFLLFVSTDKRTRDHLDYARELQAAQDRFEDFKRKQRTE
jgi:hypothetical protein